MSKVIGAMVGSANSQQLIKEMLNQVHSDANTNDESGDDYKNEPISKIIGATVGTTLNPNKLGVNFDVDSSLTLKDGILSVNTTDQMEQDNTLPITSAGVYATVGNIEALLKTI